MQKLLTDYRQLKANKPQLRAMMAMGLRRVYKLVWGRGTGKSFFIAWVMIQMSRRMPGCKIAFVGPTYKKLLRDILPGIVGALARFGYIKDVHFFVNKEPPKAWKWVKPFDAPLDFDYTIMMWHKERGSIFQLISQDRDTNARGLNIDGVIVDEALLVKKESLDKNVLATNRGNSDLFKKEPMHHSVFICSSRPYTQSGQWLHEGNDSKDVYYSEADAFENIGHGVDIRYIKDQRAIMSPLLFRIEIMNDRVMKIEGGFYENFDTAEHCYDPKYHYHYIDNIDVNLKDKLKLDCRSDDYEMDKPLDLGVDWGGNINSAVISQTRLAKHGVDLVQEERIIKAMYVKAPDIIDHLADKIMDFYRFHKNKIINLYYDVSGNTRWGNSQLTMAEQFAGRFRKNGWQINMKTITGNNANHEEKYVFLNKIFQNQRGRIVDAKLPVVQVNREDCKELIISMQMAPVKRGLNGLQKDKSSERKKNLPQEEATHFSDAFDVLIWGKWRHRSMSGIGGDFLPVMVL